MDIVSRTGRQVRITFVGFGAYEGEVRISEMDEPGSWLLFGQACLRGVMLVVLGMGPSEHRWVRLATALGAQGGLQILGTSRCPFNNASISASTVPPFWPRSGAAQRLPHVFYQVSLQHVLTEALCAAHVLHWHALTLHAKKI